MAYCFKCMRPLPADGLCPHCGQTGSPEPPEHALRPGTLLHERYLLGRVLGQGGFGITYIGRDQTLDLRVAIKEYFPFGYAARSASHSARLTIADQAQSGLVHTGMQRFLHEARTLARFDSQGGIVHVRDFFEENDTAYIVMEYLEGENLKNALANRRFSADEIFAMAAPLLDSLEKIHGQDVLHLDISPDNIMLMQDGTLKLMDFGAARSILAEDEKSRSITYKPAYAPPEQYDPHAQAGPWTDIYALCATLYQCITGIAPENSLSRLRKDTLRWPSEMGIAISTAQENALKSGMEPDCAVRCRSIAHFRAMLTAGDDVTRYIPRGTAGQSTNAPYKNSAGERNMQNEAPAPHEPVASERLSPKEAPVSQKPNVPAAPVGGAKQARDLSRGHGARPRRARALYLLCALVLLIAAGVMLFAMQKGPALPASSGETISLRLQASEQTSVAQFNEDINILRGRLSVFAGETGYDMTIDGATLNITLPADIFGEMDRESTLRSYISRPVSIFLFDATSPISWNPDREQLSRADLESVKLCGGAVPGTDLQPANGYIEFTLTDECARRLSQPISAWGENIGYGQDIEMDSFSWLPCICAGDGKTFYLVCNDEESCFTQLILYNMTHEPLSNAYSFSIDPQIDWEKTETASVHGAYQVDIQALQDDCVTLVYSSYSSELSPGEWLDTQTAFKQRLDALGQEYAFGNVRGNEYSIAVRLPAAHMGTPIASVLGTTSPMELECPMFYTLVYSTDALSAGPDGHTLLLSSSTGNQSGDSVFQKLCDYATENERPLWLTLNDMPVLCAAPVLTGQGDICFDTLYATGEPLGEQDAWLVDFLVTLQHGTQPAVSYHLDATLADNGVQYGLQYDAQNASFVQAVQSVWPQARVIFSDDNRYVYVYLGLHPDETMGGQALQLAREIYETTGFAESCHDQLVIYMTDSEDSKTKERARVIFSRVLRSMHLSDEPGYVCAHGIFMNGRLERYKDDFISLVSGDEFYQSLIDPDGIYQWIYE